jgi:Fe-S-cluster containining protein
MTGEYLPSPIGDDADAEIPTQAEAFEACARARRAEYESTIEIIENAGRTERAALELIDDTLARAQVGIDQSPGRAGRECRAGCAFCCYSHVEVHPLDAISVAQHLRQTLPPEQLAKVEERLRDRVRRKRPMTADERKQANIPCALLAEDNTCSVYAARPLICRGYSSLSVKKCEEAYLHPTQPNTAPFDFHARIWTVSVADGMRDGLAAKGIDAQRYELNSAVLCALTTPDVAAKWIKGQNVFRDCLPGREGPPPPAPAPARTARPATTASGRNDPCPCGSGKKFKKCCMTKKP